MTNWLRSPRPKEALPTLERGEHNLLDFLRSDSSLQSLPLPPAQLPPLMLRGRRTQGRLGSGKDWTPMTKEELLLMAPEGEEDPSKPSAGADKEKRSRQDANRPDRQDGKSALDSARDTETSPSKKPRTESELGDDSDLPADIRQTVRGFLATRGSGLTSDSLSRAPRAGTGLSDFFAPGSQKASFFDEALRRREALENFKRATEGKAPLEKPLGLSAFASPMLSATAAGDPFGSADAFPASLAFPTSPEMSWLGGLGGGWREAQGGAARPGPAPNLTEGKLGTAWEYLPAAPRIQPPPQEPAPAPPLPNFIFPKRAFQ